MTGDESSDDLMEMLVDITGKFTSARFPANFRSAFVHFRFSIWILDGKEDDIERALMDMMGVDRIATEQQTRKFRNLKILVLWLQKDQRFGRFCYYGCYCLPEGSHDIAAGGYGKPLDAIDRACFDFKQCYRCLLDEHDAAGQTIRNGSEYFKNWHFETLKSICHQHLSSHYLALKSIINMDLFLVWNNVYSFFRGHFAKITVI